MRRPIGRLYNHLPATTTLSPTGDRRKTIQWRGGPSPTTCRRCRAGTTTTRTPFAAFMKAKEGSSDDAAKLRPQHERRDRFLGPRPARLIPLSASRGIRFILKKTRPARVRGYIGATFPLPHFSNRLQAMEVASQRRLFFWCQA